MLNIHFSKMTLPAWLILGIGFLLSIFASLEVKLSIEQDQQLQFASSCDHLSLKIRERLDSYAQILRGGAGLYAASNTVNRQQWKAYVSTVGIGEAQGLGFAEVIEAGQLSAHIARVRSEGFADYNVRPKGERALTTSIIYLEPFSELNLRAFGYDMYSEPVRRAAMEQARDSGEAALSGKVVLVQETGAEVQAGTLMYMPVYRNGMPKNTVEERRAALLGWTYSPYRMRNFMRGIIRDWESHEGKYVDLHIYDGSVAIPDALLFDSKISHELNPHSLPLQQRMIDFNGHQWLLVFDQFSNPQAISYWPAWSVLIGGVALSGMLFALLLSVINTRVIAGRIAENLTVEVREHEALLKQSEFRWKFALEGAGDGVWDWDVASGVVFFSKRWKEIVGYAEDEFENSFKLRKQHLHPDDLEPTLGALQAYFDGKIASYMVEFRMRCKDDSWKWILARGKVVDYDAAGKPLRMIGTHSDITEQKNAQASLREHAEKHSAIFTLSLDGFVAFDRFDCVKYVSPAFTRITALSETAVQGLDAAAFSQRLSSVCVPRAQFSGVTALRAIQGVKGKPSSQKIELAGEIKCVLEVGLRDSPMENISQVLYLRDITRESEVDRIKSEFLATAAHELRTPMASIYGFTELLLTQEFTEAERLDFLFTIFKQAELMVVIINELLDLARIEAQRGKDFKIVMLNLTDLVHEAVICFKPPDKRLSPVEPEAAKALWINADSNKLTQAFNNVLSNAYKYSPEGGSVEISYVSTAEGIQPPSGTSQALTGIRVTDQGIGMTPEQLSRVCERFYRANTTGKTPGTGLGMSIVKEIIELHGGELEISSRIGAGTSVTIWLPEALN